MDLNRLIRKMLDEGTADRIARNVRAQFGTRTRPFLFAQIMPEQERTENRYEELGIRWRSTTAVPSTRHSPVTVKEGAITAGFDVTLGESDIGSRLTAKDYEQLKRVVARNGGMDAVAQVTNWLEETVNRPLLVINEIWRAQAIVDAQIVLDHNHIQKTISLPNPSGHRVTVASGTTGSPTGWYDPTHDIFADIWALVQLLADKGYTVSRMVTSTKLAGQMLKNTKFKDYFLPSFNRTDAQVSLQDWVTVFRAYGLNLANGIEKYDQVYNTTTGTARYLRHDAFVLLAETGRDVNIVVPGDENPLVLTNTIGYTGIGVPSGEDDPGRVVKFGLEDEHKPYHVWGEGWQTSGPVLLEPEAVAVITAPDPS